MVYFLIILSLRFDYCLIHSNPLIILAPFFLNFVWRIFQNGSVLSFRAGVGLYYAFTLSAGQSQGALVVVCCGSNIHAVIHLPCAQSSYLSDIWQLKDITLMCFFCVLYYYVELPNVHVSLPSLFKNLASSYALHQWFHSFLGLFLGLVAKSWLCFMLLGSISMLCFPVLAIDYHIDNWSNLSSLPLYDRKRKNC